jgi:hypothetical protein
MIMPVLFSMPVIVVIAVGVLTLLVLGLGSFRRKQALPSTANYDEQEARKQARIQRHRHLEALARRLAHTNDLTQPEEDVDNRETREHEERDKEKREREEEKEIKWKKKERKEDEALTLFPLSPPVRKNRSVDNTVRMPRPRLSPLKTLEEVLRWIAGYDGLCVASVPKRPRLFSSPTRLIVCHDMKGGYVEDAHPQVRNQGQERRRKDAEKTKTRPRSHCPVLKPFLPHLVSSLLSTPSPLAPRMVLSHVFKPPHDLMDITPALIISLRRPVLGRR